MEEKNLGEFLPALRDLANDVAKSDFYSTLKQSPAKALIIMEYGRELGVPPVMALQGINIIGGKPVVSPSLQIGVVKSKGLGDVDVIRSDETGCVLQPYKKNLEGKIVKCEPISFTEEEASSIMVWENQRKIRLIDKAQYKDGYKTDMYFARAMSRVCRQHFQNAFGGSVYSPGEIDDNDHTNFVKAEVTDAKFEETSEQPKAVEKATKKTATVKAAPAKPKLAEPIPAEEDDIPNFEAGKGKAIPEADTSEPDEDAELLEWNDKPSDEKDAFALEFPLSKSKKEGESVGDQPINWLNTYIANYHNKSKGKFLPPLELEIVRHVIKLKKQESKESVEEATEKVKKAFPGSKVIAKSPEHMTLAELGAEIMPIGNHSGSPIQTLDPEYLRKVIDKNRKNGAFDGRFIWIVDAYLEKRALEKAGEVDDSEEESEDGGFEDADD